MMITSPAQKKNRVKRNGIPRRNGKSGSSGQIHGLNRPSNGSKGPPKGSGGTLSGIAPWKIIVTILAAGLLGVGYLSHVFATQQLLRDVHKLERQYEEVRRHHDELRLKYDRMVGPAEIYDRAKDQGFVNGGPAEKIIRIED